VRASHFDSLDGWKEEQEKGAIRDCYVHFLRLRMVIKVEDEILFIGYKDNRRPKACRDYFLNILREYHNDDPE